MVHVHGAQVQQLVAQTRGVPPERLLVVPVDVGKLAATSLVCDFTGEVLVRRFEFALTQRGWPSWCGGSRRSAAGVAPAWSGSGSRPLGTITVR
jgi:hypothetical protein